MKRVSDQCMEPLDRDAVSGRKGPGGVTLDYVSQHYVRRRLCDVFGPLGFDTETRLELVSAPTKDEKGRHTVVYQATVRLTVRDPTATSSHMASVKEGSAAGVGADRQIGWATHLAITEAETDALKRAAMQLGPSFGLALYDKSQANVAPSQLRDVASAAQLEQWCKSHGQVAIDSYGPQKVEAGVAKVAGRFGATPKQVEQWLHGTLKEG